MTGPYFGIIPRRVAGLHLPGRPHAVLDVIAVHTNRETGLARVGLQAIANETGIHKRKVPDCIKSLKDKGILEIVERGGGGIGGRGHAYIYRIISDQEALSREAQKVAAEGDVSFPPAPNGKVALFDSERSPFPTLKVASGGAPTEEEQKEPPSGEARARARGGEIFSNDGGDEEVADRRQPSLFLPINGGGDRKARLAVIKSYNPLPALIERAAELGVNALAEDMLGKWRRNRIANNRLPLDFEAAEADFENWIRDEPRFANRDAERSVGRRRNGSLIQTAINEARNTNGC